MSRNADAKFARFSETQMLRNKKQAIGLACRLLPAPPVIPVFDESPASAESMSLTAFRRVWNAAF